MNMYSKEDFKFYFDTLSQMRDKVNTLQDETKELTFKLPAPLHQKIKAAHSLIFSLRDTLWEMDKMVERLRDAP